MKKSTRRTEARVPQWGVLLAELSPGIAVLYFLWFGRPVQLGSPGDVYAVPSRNYGAEPWTLNALLESAMEAYRIAATVLTPGEVVIRGLPLDKDQKVEVIVLAEPNGNEERSLLMRAAENAPSLAFLHDDAEDIYDESDLKEKFE